MSSTWYSLAVSKEGTNQGNMAYLGEERGLPSVLITIGFSVLTVLIVYNKPWSDGKAAATLGIMNTAFLLASALLRRDVTLLHLLLFGAIFGVIELLADALCVQFTGTLDYSVANSPMIWHSPWWMPIAWLVVSVQIGYLGVCLIRRIGLFRGVLLTALFGAINIPFYEEMARFAHWWEYRRCIMLWGTHTPVYIIIAELVIGLCLGYLSFLTTKTNSLKKVIGLGVLGGLSTVLGGLVGYGLVERVIPLLLGQRSSLL